MDWLKEQLEGKEARDKHRASVNAWDAAHPPSQINDWSTRPGWKPSYQRELAGEPKLFENGYRWEMTALGQHRLVDDLGRGGDWATYSSPATSPNGRFIIFTLYFDGSAPAEALIELKLVPVKS